MKNKIKKNSKKIKKKSGAVLWLTGLSGSGKSTIGDSLHEILNKKGISAQRLDGDILREHFENKLGFNKEGRDLNIKISAFTSSLLEKHGVIVISSFISPYKHQRDFARNLSKKFIEIHVNASVETCIKRDTKGLYKKALAGEIKNFTGISDPYEVPENPHLVIDTDILNIKDSVKKVLDYLTKEGII
ncbi:MAG: adenylyl-sulfate kinase [Candidatus Paceibacterota bacterium]|jgi:adenylylsulfate kinase